MRKVVGLFPTPLMVCQGTVPAELAGQLTEHVLAGRRATNAGTDLLSHTQMVEPDGNRLYRDVVAAVTPEIERFGALLFGDRLPWLVKEMWMNVLERGGSQFMHTHANSFVSGIVYLTKPHASTKTVFLRHMGATEFIFRHDAADGGIGQFNADRWVLPDVEPGDLVLYPSYLLHGVPPNEGERRLSLALNAVPKRLQSFDYEIRFAR
ncbi:MAG: putative 2OG-Fe(II) oxygenase [Pseudomonadota bacterium]